MFTRTVYMYMSVYSGGRVRFCEAKHDKQPQLFSENNFLPLQILQICSKWGIFDKLFLQQVPFVAAVSSSLLSLDRCEKTTAIPISLAQGYLHFLIILEGGCIPDNICFRQVRLKVFLITRLRL